MVHETHWKGIAMKRTSALLVLFTLVFATTLTAKGREDDVDRVSEAATVLNEIMKAPDKGIPLEILHDALCVAIVPGLLKGGFVFGGAYGKGVATCKTSHGWSAPAFFKIEGGSFGLQIGGQAVDYVMVFMDDYGMKTLLSSKFKLGADASAAAGPVGRHVEGMTDWKMKNQILTYSRARGIFAGITLNGAAIHQDDDAVREFYGRRTTFRTILNGQIECPKDGTIFQETVGRHVAEADRDAKK
jgi:lipid-binding SYLF domain-containing protein